MPQTVKKTKTPEQALQALMRLCARAERSSGDALRLMRGWGVEPSDRHAVLERLVRERFIDDSRYADAFVRDKVRFSGWGVYKIRQALLRKGIGKDTVESAIAQMDSGALSVRIRRQMEKKMRTIRSASPFELRTKLIRYALSLGYEYDQVLAAADELINEVENERD